MLSLLDVFLLTSEMEANPVSILEAMATEKPVVAPDVGSVPETVAHRRTGFLFAPKDVNASASFVVDLLQNRELAAEMGRRAREQVISNWSVQRMVEGYQDMIAEIYTKKTGGKKTDAGQADSRDDGIKVKKLTVLHHASNQAATSLAQYVMMIEAPARLTAVSDSSTAAFSFIQPRAAAALTMLNSPDTL